MDETTVLRKMRSDVRPPEPAELRAGEVRLWSAIEAAESPGQSRWSTSGFRSSVSSYTAWVRQPRFRGRQTGEAPDRLGRERASRRRPRLALGLALATLLVGGLAAAAVVVRAGDERLPGGGPAGRGPGRGLAPAPSGSASSTPRLRPVSVTQLLDLAAVRAERRPEINPRPDQYVYREVQVIQTIVSSYGAGPAEMYVVERVDKTWLLPDGGRGASVAGREQARPFPGKSFHPPSDRPTGESPPRAICGTIPNGYRIDLQYMNSLPTDPTKMRDFIYSQAGLGTLPAEARREPADPAGVSPDDVAFLVASEMVVEAYIPPKQSAAIFRAVATIPGVVLLPGAVNVAGRPSVAVAHADEVDAAGGTQRQMLFDADTFAFIGQRSVVVDDELAQAPVGTVNWITAELKVEVVDRMPVEIVLPPECAAQR